MTKRSLSRALAQCAPGARDPLESVLQGKELSFEQGLRLAKVEGADLEALVAVADYLRSETVGEDRKSTRLNSSHITISYAVFCLKKKNKKSSRGERCTADKSDPHTQAGSKNQ